MIIIAINAAVAAGLIRAVKMSSTASPSGRLARDNAAAVSGLRVMTNIASIVFQPGLRTARASRGRRSGLLTSLAIDAISGVADGQPTDGKGVRLVMINIVSIAAALAARKPRGAGIVKHAGDPVRTVIITIVAAVIVITPARIGIRGGLDRCGGRG